ncbi:MAG: hypothetical protein PHZ19_09920 [Candidatus Thermoplasmatota archaeon]|nr:hypothetical protein [Candidatus Thermoplasmatota archaeon]
MNKQEQQYEENKRAQLVQMSNRFGSHVNCFRYSAANSIKHEFAKFILFTKLRDEGDNVFVEAIFDNNLGRADIFDLTDCIAYEILETETGEQAERKAHKYPVRVKAFHADVLIRNFIEKLGVQ